MARLILLLLAVAVIVAVTLIVASALRAALGEAGRSGGRHVPGNMMEPTGIRKFGYVALIVLMFGTASGWLGGL